MSTSIKNGGRGTNRVIEECERHGIEPPIFEGDEGFVIITYSEIAPGPQPRAIPARNQCL